MTFDHATAWAYQEFSGAELGDQRRKDRVVQMAAGMAASPAGNITTVFTKEAEREAAYRFVRNSNVDGGELSRAAMKATARRCFGERIVFVPVDGCSLNLPDRNGTRGMGRIGTHGVGLQMMSAIAVDGNGVPLGLCGQRYWSRSKPVGLKANSYDPREHCEKESRYWLEVIGAAVETFANNAPSTKPFFQLDRGGDDWRVLAYAVDNDVLVTTRAAHNRRVGGTHLWATVSTVEPQCSYIIDVPEGPERSARRASVQVQFRSVAINVRDRRSGERRDLAMSAVRVVEVGTIPVGEKGIEWMLLTTFPVANIDDALFVVRGYVTRWRIEEFHKTLKSGACRLEESLLRSRENFERFAVISSSVAIHLQRVLHLSRTSPDEPATIVLTRPQIDAAILLREPKGVSPGDTPCIADAVRWIADIGGFMGPAQRTIRAAMAAGTPIRRPGLKVVRRGFEKLESVAVLLANRALKL